MVERRAIHSDCKGNFDPFFRVAVYGQGWQFTLVNCQPFNNRNPSKRTSNLGLLEKILVNELIT